MSEQTASPEEDSGWPPELILLREKFTAKNQLEITQLQIKHEEEMQRLKVELQRKQKRHTAFDTNRNLDQVVSERDNLRELSNTLRRLLYELAKYCSVCETDLNHTLAEDLKRHGAFNQSHNNNNNGNEEESEDPNCSNQSTLTSSSRRPVKFNLDLSSILSLVDDPSLIEYISRPNEVSELEFNLEQCLEQLKLEAGYILKLSEKIARKDATLAEDGGDDVEIFEKEDSCEDEDGLKKRKSNGHRQASLNENLLCNGGHGDGAIMNGHHGKSVNSHSLPVFRDDADGDDRNGTRNSINMNELKNRLLKSEDERKHLELELNKVVTRNNSLVQELEHTKEVVEVLEGRREYVSEG